MDPWAGAEIRVQIYIAEVYDQTTQRRMLFDDFCISAPSGTQPTFASTTSGIQASTTSVGPSTEISTASCILCS